jgi:hypothetical protein
MAVLLMMMLAGVVTRRGHTATRALGLYLPFYRQKTGVG